MRGIIRSSLEKHRESLGPPVIDGETYLVFQQASLDGGNNMFASWKPGYLYLTATRLLFYQGPNKLFELPTGKVRGAEIVERRWISKKTCPQLAVRQETPRGESTIHLRVDDLEGWRDRLRALTQPESDAVAKAGDACPQPNADEPVAQMTDDR